MRRKIRHARAAFFDSGKKANLAFGEMPNPFFSTPVFSCNRALIFSWTWTRTSITVIEQYSTQQGAQKAELDSPRGKNWTANLYKF